MNADEVRTRWPLGSRFVATHDRTRRVRVVQAHVAQAVPGPDALMLAHDRHLYWPSECELPPPLPVVLQAEPLPAPQAEDVAQRLRRAMAAPVTDAGNWQRLQQRISAEAEQQRRREQEEREAARARERAEREERARQREEQARETGLRREEARRQEALLRARAREEPSPSRQLEAKVAELQRLLSAAHDALAQIQEQICPKREMPMYSGKQEDNERRLILDEETTNESHNDG